MSTLPYLEDPSKQRACRLIVLTGGPGAGKTAVLEAARLSMGRQVVFLPEAAGILFGGGFWRSSSAAGRKAAQRAIFHIQREQERMVLEEQQTAFAICDRGTLDGAAYWPDDEQSFWQELMTTKKAELSRYHAVIHLRTPDERHGYNHQNPLRVEDAARAGAIDERILSLWSGHPNRYVVDTADDFLLKAKAALQLLQSLASPALERQITQPL